MYICCCTHSEWGHHLNTSTEKGYSPHYPNKGILTPLPQQGDTHSATPTRGHSPHYPNKGTLTSLPQQGDTHPTTPTGGHSPHYPNKGTLTPLPQQGDTHPTTPTRIHKVTSKELSNCSGDHHKVYYTYIHTKVHTFHYVYHLDTGENFWPTSK